MNGQTLLLWAKFNRIPPSVATGGDLYHICSFSAFLVPPRCCQNDGLNHLWVGVGGGGGAEQHCLDCNSKDGAFSLIVSSLELVSGTFTLLPCMRVISECLLKQMLFNRLCLQICSSLYRDYRHESVLQLCVHAYLRTWSSLIND